MVLSWTDCLWLSWVWAIMVNRVHRYLFLSLSSFSHVCALTVARATSLRYHNGGSVDCSAAYLPPRSKIDFPYTGLESIIEIVRLPVEDPSWFSGRPTIDETPRSPVQNRLSKLTYPERQHKKSSTTVKPNHRLPFEEDRKLLM